MSGDFCQLAIFRAGDALYFRQNCSAFAKSAVSTPRGPARLPADKCDVSRQIAGQTVTVQRLPAAAKLLTEAA